MQIIPIVYKNENIVIKIIKVLLAFAPLAIGGGLYLGYRSKELIMFKWSNTIGVDSIINTWRDICSQCILPTWITHALPDGLWLLSYLLLIDIVWDSELNKWIYVLPTIALISEALQLWIPTLGTFDIMDLACYMGAVILFKLKKITQWKEKKL